MKRFTADVVRQKLISSINSLFGRRDEFLRNPQSDFTRTQKISFQQTLLFPMLAGSEDIDDELMAFFEEEKLPFASAMIQRRNQIKPEAFRELFYQFSKSIPVRNTFRSFQLAAIDGCRLNLPFNPRNPDTFIQSIEGRKGINQIHMNALYDPLNDFFLDVNLQYIHQMDEKEAFCQFLDNNRDADSYRKRIYLADRGYASYNIFAHAIHNNQVFLIRVPEVFAKNMCTNSCGWLDGQYVDEIVTLHIGRRNTTKNKQLKNYHYIPSSGHYSFINAKTDDVDQFHLRVLKFPIGDDSFEYIVTNLPKYAFSLQTIKDLYHVRWGIETAFRHLKYAGNMVHIHSLKQDHVIQEIYGKLTLYNFSSFLASTIDSATKETDRYVYVIDHSKMQKIIIRYLKGLVKNVEGLIARYLVPIRPDRTFQRNLRRQSADTLNYR